ncbi:hypothetical protein AAHA92_12141 [Salvia divinorum]|uniref:Uncharacterized protein n=1 Tax=Salvia divinorum TaxID=28513 RepID=A0ABD1HJA5_SALDI
MEERDRNFHYFLFSNSKFPTDFVQSTIHLIDLVLSRIIRSKYRFLIWCCRTTNIHLSASNTLRASAMVRMSARKRNDFLVRMRVLQWCG